MIENINHEQYDESKYYKLILTGTKNFEINTGELLKYITHTNIVKIKDNTKLDIDLESISEQNNLKGIFVKELLEEIQNHPEEKENIEKAIEIGLEAF